MNELALFAGGGGSILAGKLLGWSTRCAVEIDSYARQILLARQRDGILKCFPIWDDVRTFDGRAWRGNIDVITAGFPCQDISQAGKGAGITGPQSGLWKEAARIIDEVRPRFAFLENSHLLTHRGLGVVLGDLAYLGFDAEWSVFSARNNAACCHTRRRIYIVTHANSTSMEGMDLPQFAIIDPQKSRSRQFTRAVGATLSEDDYTRMPRNTDALAAGMDRLKVSGNGWVPQVAVHAWYELMRRFSV